MMSKERLKQIASEEKRLAAETKLGFHRVDDGPGRHGLYLQIAGANARSWVFRYWQREDGKRRCRDMGLGSAFIVPLQLACEAADQHRLDHTQGIDPLEKRRKAEQAARLEKAKLVTFKQCAEEYITQHSPSWKNEKHRAQWYMTLLGRTPEGKPTAENYCKALHAKPIQEITVADVLDILRPIWLIKTETASRIRNRIELVINYATPTYRTGDNPAAMAILKSKLPKANKVRRVKHHRSLPYKELPGFMKGLRARPGISCRALEFAILTIGRTDEVLSARWPQIDLDEGYWSIDGEDMKNDRAHRVWLCPRAIEILRELQAKSEPGGYIFPGMKLGQPLSENSLIKVVKLMGYHDRAVPHGFRGTFSTWAEKEARDKEGMRFPDPMIELCMSHEVGSEVRRAYKRPDGRDLRQELLEVWAEFCSGGAAPVGSNVVRYPARASA